MQLKKGQTIDATISDLAFGGAGVGKFSLDGQSELVVFIEGAVPGDQVSATLTKIKPQYAEAKLENIRVPSSSRIAPRCKHFGVCGGCSLQSLSYDDQLKWKQKMVEDALKKIGGFKEHHVEKIIGCSSPWFYRNKMEYSFGITNNKAQMTNAVTNDRAYLGLHPKKKFATVFDLDECFLQSQRSVELAHAVELWAQELGIASYDPRTQSGTLKTLFIREGKNTGDRMINLVTNGRTFEYDKEFKNFLLKSCPDITSAYRTGVTIQKGHRTVTEEFHLAGKKIIRERLTVSGKNKETPLTLQFEILPQAFFQPNTLQAQLLYETVLAFASPRECESVLDLFCGTGTIGMFFAKLGCAVQGIDMNASAIENARENAKKNGLTNINFICANAFRIASTASERGRLQIVRNQRDLEGATRAPIIDQNPTDIIITDPPRAGIDKSTLEKIIALQSPRWIYVSCNPTTLARDLKIICAEYSLKKIQPIDMFPHTYHVETVCLLEQK